MQTISPFLWFDDQAEQAAELYTSVFPRSSILEVTRYGEGAPQAGTAMVVTFVLDGLELQALNGGPGFPFTEAVSLSVKAETQEEIDDLWAKLTDGGQAGRCGWLTDRYGLSWQVVPTVLGQLLSDPDPARAARAMQAMLGMSKLDIAGLRAAADG